MLELYQGVARSQEGSVEFYPNAQILIPPTMQTDWKVLTEDRKWILCQGTHSKCVDFVRSLDSDSDLVLKLPNGDRHIVPFKIIITQS